MENGSPTLASSVFASVAELAVNATDNFALEHKRLEVVHVFLEHKFYMYKILLLALNKHSLREYNGHQSVARKHTR